jgi:hypothetical protein
LRILLENSFGVIKNCDGSNDCEYYMGKRAQEMFTNRPHWYNFGEDHWDTNWVFEMCSGCKNDAKMSFLSGSNAMWEGLPEAFGLGTWEQLKQQME